MGVCAVASRGVQRGTAPEEGCSGRGNRASPRLHGSDADAAPATARLTRHGVQPITMSALADGGPTSSKERDGSGAVAGGQPVRQEPQPSPSSASRSSRSDGIRTARRRRALFSYLHSNLFCAADDLYSVCEFQSSVADARRAVRELRLAASDFESLADNLEAQEAGEGAAGPKAQAAGLAQAAPPATARPPAPDATPSVETLTRSPLSDSRAAGSASGLGTAAGVLPPSPPRDEGRTRSGTPTAGAEPAAARASSVVRSRGSVAWEVRVPARRRAHRSAGSARAGQGADWEEWWSRRLGWTRRHSQGEAMALLARLDAEAEEAAAVDGDAEEEEAAAEEAAAEEEAEEEADGTVQGRTEGGGMGEFGAQGAPGCRSAARGGEGPGAAAELETAETAADSSGVVPGGTLENSPFVATVPPDDVTAEPPSPPAAAAAAAAAAASAPSSGDLRSIVVSRPGGVSVYWADWDSDTETSPLRIHHAGRPGPASSPPRRTPPRRALRSAPADDRSAAAAGRGPAAAALTERAGPAGAERPSSPGFGSFPRDAPATPMRHRRTRSAPRIEARTPEDGRAAAAAAVPTATSSRPDAATSSRPDAATSSRPWSTLFAPPASPRQAQRQTPRQASAATPPPAVPRPGPLASPSPPRRPALPSSVGGPPPPAHGGDDGSWLGGTRRGGARAAAARGPGAAAIHAKLSSPQRAARPTPKQTWESSRRRLAEADARRTAREAARRERLRRQDRRRQAVLRRAEAERAGKGAAMIARLEGAAARHSAHVEGLRGKASTLNGRVSEAGFIREVTKEGRRRELSDRMGGSEARREERLRGISRTLGGRLAAVKRAGQAARAGSGKGAGRAARTALHASTAAPAGALPGTRPLTAAPSGPGASAVGELGAAPPPPAAAAAAAGGRAATPSGAVTQGRAAASPSAAASSGGPQPAAWREVPASAGVSAGAAAASPTASAAAASGSAAGADHTNPGSKAALRERRRRAKRCREHCAAAAERCAVACSSDMDPRSSNAAALTALTATADAAAGRLGRGRRAVEASRRAIEQAASAVGGGAGRGRSVTEGALAGVAAAAAGLERVTSSRGGMRWLPPIGDRGSWAGVACALAGAVAGWGEDGATSAGAGEVSDAAMALTRPSLIASLASLVAPDVSATAPAVSAAAARALASVLLAAPAAAAALLLVPEGGTAPGLAGLLAAAAALSADLTAAVSTAGTPSDATATAAPPGASLPSHRSAAAAFAFVAAAAVAQWGVTAADVSLPFAIEAAADASAHCRAALSLCKLPTASASALGEAAAARDMESASAAAVPAAMLLASTALAALSAPSGPVLAAGVATAASSAAVESAAFAATSAVRVTPPPARPPGHVSPPRPAAQADTAVTPPAVVGAGTCASVFVALVAVSRGAAAAASPAAFWSDVATAGGVTQPSLAIAALVRAAAAAIGEPAEGAAPVPSVVANALAEEAAVAAGSWVAACGTEAARALWFGPAAHRHGGTTPLEMLCRLPLRFLTDQRGRAAVVPTLTAVVRADPEAAAIVRRHIADASLASTDEAPTSGWSIPRRFAQSRLAEA